MFEVEIYGRVRSGSSRGPESTGGSQAVWAFARYGTEDAGVRCATGYQRQQPIKCPKLGPWLGVIEAILNDDKLRPAKQRHTASGSSIG